MDDTVRILCKGDDEDVFKAVQDDLILQGVVDEIITYEEHREYAVAIRASRGLEVLAIAKSYMDGVGVRQDPDLGIRWHYVAAMNGHYDSAAIISRHLADEVLSLSAIAEVQKKKGNEWINVPRHIARVSAAVCWWACFSRIGIPEYIDTMTSREPKLEIMEIPKLAYVVHASYLGGQARAIGLDDADKILRESEGHRDRVDNRRKVMAEQKAAREAGKKLADRVAKSYEGHKEGWGDEESPDDIKNMRGTNPPEDDIDFDSLRHATSTDHVVSVYDIDFPKDASHTTKEIYTRLMQPQPMPAMPDLDSLEADLRSEFPYLDGAITAILKDLRMRAAYGAANFLIRPLLLVGPTGVGKTRFATRIADLSRCHNATISCAGSADNRDLDGTSRGYNTGTPSLLARTLAKASVGGALFIFDEVDKTALSNHNGNIRDSLINMLESQNSYTDQYLQVQLDLSKCSFILTANDTKHLPMPLLSRCRLVECGKPTKEHVPSLVRGIIYDLARELDVDPRFIASPDDVEMRALEGHFDRTGSVRTLKRGVERLLELRDRTAVPN